MHIPEPQHSRLQQRALEPSQEQNPAAHLPVLHRAQ